MTNTAPSTKLRNHIARTYASQRLGTAALGAVLPVALLVGGRVLDDEALRASMSAYYYSPSVSDWFVGGLVAIGALLFLYRGFSRAEDWLLNAAGILIVLVAFVPTAPTDEGGASFLSWHGTFAVAFFLCIASVCIFRASDTLSLIRNEQTARRYRALYRLVGGLMIALPVAAMVLSSIQGSGAQGSRVFLAEAVAVWVFAAYWLLKSRELHETHAEHLALERKLLYAARHPSSVPGRLVQIEPGELPARGWQDIAAVGPTKMNHASP